jgi:P4 family phage/plasmid primase-like protien
MNAHTTKEEGAIVSGSQNVKQQGESSVKTEQFHNIAKPASGEHNVYPLPLIGDGFHGKTIDGFPADSFCIKDLARSGLVPSDFPVGVKVLPPNDEGQDRYQFGVTADYWKTRVNRKENKYYGPKGVTPPIAVFGEFHDANITATVEGYKKALLFHMTTGIPTLSIDGCWMFGELFETDQEAPVKNLASTILERLSPGKPHVIIFDGDIATNEDVRRAASTYRVLLEEQGVITTFKNLGCNDKGERLGYDDWFVDTFGADRALWSAPVDNLKHLLVSVPDVPPQLLIGGALSFMLGSLDRFSSEFLDLNDRGAGSLLLKLLGVGNLRYLSDTDEWAHWTGTEWLILSRKQAISLVNVVSKYYYERATALGVLADKHTDEEKATQLRQQANSCRTFAATSCSNAVSRGNIIKDLMSRREITGHTAEFDNVSHLLGVDNGVVNLKTGEVRPLQRDDMVTRKCAAPYSGAEPPAEFTDEDGVTRNIKSFLHEMFGHSRDDNQISAPDLDLVEYAQQRFGVMLYGANLLQGFDNWFGPRGTAKSTLGQIVIGTLGDAQHGGYGKAMKPEVILKAFSAKNPEGANPFLVMLRGARFVFMAETEDNAALNGAFIKTLTGDNQVTARGNYQDGAAMNVSFNLVLATNNLPILDTSDAALIDRLCVTPFEVRYRRDATLTQAGDEGLPEADVWWVHEANKHPAVKAYVLWWLLQGALKWQKAGRKLPAAPERVVKHLKAYIAENDDYADWMSDCAWKFSPNHAVKSSVLFQSYSNWAIQNGRKPASNRTFTKRLIQRYPKELSHYTGTANSRYLQGLNGPDKSFAKDDIVVVLLK